MEAGRERLVGVTLGCVAGYYGGVIGSLIMRVTDVIQTFPDPDHAHRGGARHRAAAARYAEEKQSLALRYRDDRHAYVAAKRPMTWTIMDEADEWSQAVGWEPGVSDA